MTMINKYKDYKEKFSRKLMTLDQFPGYAAGSDGHIYSYWVRNSAHKATFPKRLKSIPNTNGYLTVNLKSQNGILTKNVHRLVAMAFHGYPPPGFTCSHVDGDRCNNRPENLVWESMKDNVQRKKNHGTLLFGTRHPNAKFSSEDIVRIKRRLDRGVPYAHIARHYGVDIQTISKIARGVSYKDVKTSPI